MFVNDDGRRGSGGRSESPPDISLCLQQNDIPFDSSLPEKLSVYLRLLEEWNRHMDLTAVLEPEEMLDRHVVDSLSVLKTDLLPSSGSLIDVGTGAGLPGLLLALARPDLQVTLLDAQNKRLCFLQAVCDELGVKNVSLVHARAEDGGRRPDLRERFDVAVARAVAPLSVLCEYLLPYVRTGGVALCWKGPALEEEIEAGRRAAHLLGGRLAMPVPCPILNRDWNHRILPVRKIQPTPKLYPRKAGLPKAQPLGQ